MWSFEYTLLEGVHGRFVFYSLMEGVSVLVRKTWPSNILFVISLRDVFPCLYYYHCIVILSCWFLWIAFLLNFAAVVKRVTLLVIAPLEEAPTKTSFVTGAMVWDTWPATALTIVLRFQPERPTPTPKHPTSSFSVSRQIDWLPETNWQ